MPKAITVDNGTQFDAETFKAFCDQIGTKIHFASLRHPESNGLVERANGIIITGIMKSIFNQPKGKWPDELIKVVWNHNTVVSRSTGFTPFKLLFRDDAITSEEARTGSIRTLASAEDKEDCKITKDAIEGTRLQAVDHINKYQAEIVKWRDRKVRLKTSNQDTWCFGWWPTEIQWENFNSNRRVLSWWCIRQDLDRTG
jgi:transposase InsO family protein